MAASIGVDNLFADDFSIINVIQLELFGMAKVLKDLSAFICNCNSHRTTSFLHDFLMNLNWFELATSAGYQQPLSMNERVRNLFPCAIVNRSDCCTGNVHSCSTGFLGKAFIVQKS